MHTVVWLEDWRHRNFIDDNIKKCSVWTVVNSDGAVRTRNDYWHLIRNWEFLDYLRDFLLRNKVYVMSSQSELLITGRMALRTFPVKLLEVFKNIGGDTFFPFLLRVRMVAEK